MLGIATDVTDRKFLEDQLRESEERFRLMADTAPVLLWMSGPDNMCHYFNRPWLEFTGRSIEAELGEGWAEGVHPDDLARCLETYARAFDTREPFRREYRLRRYDETYRWVLDTGVPRKAPDGTFAGYIGSALDVTSLKLAEDTLAGLSQRLITDHEMERTLVARELHDDLGQRMALLTIDLERWKQSLPDGAADARIQALCALATDVGHDLQVISNRLHSSRMEFLGIAAEAANFCRELSERRQVTIDFSHRSIPASLPDDIALCLFRVLQEALHNAVTHAGVQHFVVALSGGENLIQLDVVDHGRGFDVEAVEGYALGLTNMRQRLRLVKGQVSIVSRPGAGTLVRARVPWGGVGAT
jgi:PAS domain S-box-containing protein